QVNGNAISKGAIAVACLAGGMNDVSSNVIANGGHGVVMTQETGPLVERNRINNMAGWAVGCLGALGQCDIGHNRITSCGFGAAGGTSLLAYALLGALNVEANEVMNTGLSTDGKTAFAGPAVGI